MFRSVLSARGNESAHETHKVAERSSRAAHKPDLAPPDPVDVERAANGADEQHKAGAARGDEGRGARVQAGLGEQEWSIEEDLALITSSVGVADRFGSDFKMAHKVNAAELLEHIQRDAA